MNAPLPATLAADWRNTLKSLRETYPDADDQTLFDTCDGLTSAADVVAEFVRRSIEAQAMAEANLNLSEMYAQRARAMVARNHRFRDAALRLMLDAGMDNQPLRRPEFTLSVSHRAGKPEVYDEEALPESLYRYKTVRSVDREKLAEAVAAGDVPGVRMTNGSTSLTVRMK